MIQTRVLPQEASAPLVILPLHFQIKKALPFPPNKWMDSLRSPNAHAAPLKNTIRQIVNAKRSVSAIGGKKPDLPLLGLRKPSYVYWI